MCLSVNQGPEHFPVRSLDIFPGNPSSRIFPLGNSLRTFPKDISHPSLRRWAEFTEPWILAFTVIYRDVSRVLQFYVDIRNFLCKKLNVMHA